VSRPQERPGLQAERTQLSWERTAVGFLASGAIPLLRSGGPLAPGKIGLAVLATLLALLVVWISRDRARHFRTSAAVAVHLIGGATAVFATVIVVLLVLRL
jgi:uncharacterized membrane protein YidH (DUF202 family)